MSPFALELLPEGKEGSLTTTPFAPRRPHGARIQVSLVLEYADLGTLRDALDAEAFKLRECLHLFDRERGAGCRLVFGGWPLEFGVGGGGGGRGRGCLPNPFDAAP